MLGVDSWDILHAQKSTKPREVNLHIARAVIFICGNRGFKAMTTQLSSVSKNNQMMLLTKSLSRHFFIWSLS